MNKMYRIIAGVVISLYFFISIITLQNYGVNWDESAHLTRGQAYLYFFLTGKEQYDKELFKGKHSFYQIQQYNFRYQKIKDGDHPVLSDILSSLFNYTFYQKFEVINDFDSYHLYGPVLVSFFLIFLFFWVERYYGSFAALISVLTLVLYPLFYGESHFNVQKDIPVAVFYGLALMSFYRSYVERSAKWILVSAIFFGFGFGTKFNILFMPITIVPWLLIKERLNVSRKFWSLRGTMKYSFFIYPLIGFSFLYFSWPHLWYDPMKNLLQVVTYYRTVGAATYSTTPATYFLFGFNTYAIQWILYTTPLIILFLVVIAVVYGFIKGWREKNKTALFVFFWFLVPITRVTMPNANIYGGVRQIMEYIPAMAILAGIGATYIVTWLHGFIVTRLRRFKLSTIKQWSNQTMLILQLTIVLSFIPITLRIISLFPNESVYFNSLIGGLKGAKERDIPGWGNTLGSTYRQGKYWLNEHAEKNAKVALIYELGSNVPKGLLRDDIKYSNAYRSGPKREGEYVMGLTHQGTFEELYHRRYLERFLIPVYEVKVDSVPILKIWKNDYEHTKREFRKEEKEIENIMVKKEVGEGRVVIDFSRVVRLTKITVTFAEENCVIPKGGKIRISKDGNNWETLPISFLEFPGFGWWFKPHMEKGKLQYLFAADEARYVRFSKNTEDSCLLMHPVEVGAWGI